MVHLENWYYQLTILRWYICGGTFVVVHLQITNVKSIAVVHLSVSEGKGQHGEKGKGKGEGWKNQQEEREL